MTEQEILWAIAEHFLCVRRLPFKTIEYWTYREGDENKIWVDSNGNPSKYTRELVIQEFDLEWFKNNKPNEWEGDLTPEQRFERFLKTHPTGQRKLLKTEKIVENGGWWYVKKAEHTSSSVEFNKKRDKFFAPTLAEAVQLYLNSLK